MKFNVSYVCIFFEELKIVLFGEFKGMEIYILFNDSIDFLCDFNGMFLLSMICSIIDFGLEKVF